MPQKTIAFRCYHPDCAGDPELKIIIEVPAGTGQRSGKKQMLVYCERNHPNLLNVPQNWNGNEPVLGGDDEDLDGRSGGLIILKGRKP